MQALFGLFLGEEKVHSSTAGLRISRVFQGRLKLLISHVPLLSETMCFYSADYMLIAKVVRGGGGCAMCSPPFVANMYAWKKTSSSECRKAKASWKKCLSALSDLYRSWVPDEDLGMSIGVLICWDLEVSHQHLHSFPTESQRGSRVSSPACLTCQLAANNTKAKKSPARLAGDDPSMNGAEQQLSKIEQIESVLSPQYAG